MSGEASTSSSKDDGNAAYNAAKKDAEERPFRYARYSDIQAKDVCGSTAGAGSGDFHEYRAIRRINLEREKQMDKEYEIEQRRKEYLEKKQALEAAANEKTSKKAAKRRRKKERKQQAKLANLQQRNKYASDGSFKEQFERARQGASGADKGGDAKGGGADAADDKQLSESDLVKQKLMEAAAAAAADDVEAELAAALMEEAAAASDDDAAASSAKKEADDEDEPSSKRQKV